MEKKLPIRLKVELIECLKKIMSSLYQKDSKKIEELSEEIKKRAIFLEEAIQGDVLRFVEAVQFQVNYDPLVTEEIGRQADRLIEDLGFMPPAG